MGKSRGFFEAVARVVRLAAPSACAALVVAGAAAMTLGCGHAPPPEAREQHPCDAFTEATFEDAPFGPGEARPEPSVEPEEPLPLEAALRPDQKGDGGAPIPSGLVTFQCASSNGDGLLLDAERESIRCGATVRLRAGHYNLHMERTAGRMDLVVRDGAHLRVRVTTHPAGCD